MTTPWHSGGCGQSGQSGGAQGAQGAHHAQADVDCQGAKASSPENRTKQVPSFVSSAPHKNNDAVARRIEGTNPHVVNRVCAVGGPAQSDLNPVGKRLSKPLATTPKQLKDMTNRQRVCLLDTYPVGAQREVTAAITTVQTTVEATVRA